MYESLHADKKTFTVKLFNQFIRQQQIACACLWSFVREEKKIDFEYIS